MTGLTTDEAELLQQATTATLDRTARRLAVDGHATDAPELVAGWLRDAADRIEPMGQPGTGAARMLDLLAGWEAITVASAAIVDLFTELAVLVHADLERCEPDADGHGAFVAAALEAAAARIRDRG